MDAVRPAIDGGAVGKDMRMIFYNSQNLVDETPCPGCGWPKSSCLCGDWQTRAEAAEAALVEAQRERDSLREQVAALRALMAQAVQADLDDDAFALEAAIVRMADALDDNGQDARGG